MRSSTRRRPLVLIGTLAVAILLTAAGSHAPDGLPILRPGSPDLHVAHIHDLSDSAVFVRAMPGDSTKKLRVVTYQRERLLDDPRGPSVLLISQSPGYVDSAVILRSTLQPVSEIQNYLSRHRRIRYDYDGSTVRRRDSTADSVAQVKDHDFGAPFFHFNELKLVIRSLPLRAGYAALLPLYSEGADSVEMDTVSVVGKNDRGAWTVRYADPTLAGTYMIDDKTRLIVNASSTRPDK